ncbi:MAG TPA: hypothetical protein VGC20_01590 [bacterium]
MRLAHLATHSIRLAGRRLPAPVAAALALWALPAAASPVEVVHARFERSGDAWDVSVTLRHADSGWQHYANLWVVERLDGTELGRRVLLHPHEDEQPFTRSERIRIPAGVTRVRVRAGDTLSGIDGNTVVVDLTQARGDRFEVQR